MKNINLRLNVAAFALACMSLAILAVPAAEAEPSKTSDFELQQGKSGWSLNEKPRMVMFLVRPTWMEIKA